MKKEFSTAVIALVIAVPLSLFTLGQQKQNAEMQKMVFTPVMGVRLGEYERITQDEVPEVTEEEPEYISLGEFKLTAYCSCEKCCGRWASNRPVDEDGKKIVIGASGEVLEAGISIAVDKNVIPYGSKVLIGDHEYIAHDCGGAIKQNRIDVYFADHQEALEFGVQYAEAFLLKEGEKDGT